MGRNVGQLVGVQQELEFRLVGTCFEIIITSRYDEQNRLYLTVGFLLNCGWLLSSEDEKDHAE